MLFRTLLHGFRVCLTSFKKMRGTYTGWLSFFLTLHVVIWSWSSNARIKRSNRVVWTCANGDQLSYFPGSLDTPNRVLFWMRSKTNYASQYLPDPFQSGNYFCHPPCDCSQGFRPPSPWRVRCSHYCSHYPTILDRFRSARITSGFQWEPSWCHTWASYSWTVFHLPVQRKQQSQPIIFIFYELFSET